MAAQDSTNMYFVMAGGEEFQILGYAGRKEVF